MLQRSLGAQQQPRADGIQAVQRGAVDLDSGDACDVQRTQVRIEAASLADDPEAADHQAQGVALAFGAVPGGVRRCRGANYRGHGAKGAAPRPRWLGRWRVRRIDVEAVCVSRTCRGRGNGVLNIPPGKFGRVRQSLPPPDRGVTSQAGTQRRRN